MRRFHKEKIPRYIRDAIIERDNGLCWICGCKCKGYESFIDHVYPEKLGGSSKDPDNLRVICEQCNLRKRTDNPYSKFFAKWIYVGERRKVSLSVNENLLKAIDEIAEREQISRSTLVSALLAWGIRFI